MKKLFILAISGLLSTPAVAGFKESFEARYYQRAIERPSSKKGKTEYKPIAIGQGFEQFIDPTNPMTSPTFTQRYWIDSQYAAGKDSPVILFLCGEWTCGPKSFNGVAQYASSLKAYMVAMEHRYYGESQPFEKLTAENLRFLTTANALTDFARLQVAIQSARGWTGKWIVVGASYSANLAAYYRTLYPNLVVGAYASSGPVKIKQDFEEYDYHVATVAGPQCNHAIRSVVTKIEENLDNPEGLGQLKKLFEAEKLTDNIEFLYLVADMAALAIQYGYRDQFCKEITENTAIKGYSDFAKRIYGIWNMTAVTGSVDDISNEDPKHYMENGAGRAWTYQTCTEYGYWQVAYHDPAKSARSRFITSEFHRANCQKLFNVKDPVSVSAMNREFYQPLLDPQSSSRILFTNGSRDPWTKLSIDESNNNNVNALNSSLLIDGASHCSDLHEENFLDSTAIRNARKVILQKMKDWLEISI